MNIFVLDENPSVAACYHNDKHVVKMILESAQLLCSALHICGSKYQIPSNIYKLTHKNHPCSLWTRESIQNWEWLKQLAFELNNQWRYRFNHQLNKEHKSFQIIKTLPDPILPDIGLTKFKQCMPKEFIGINPVVSYRLYYISNKKHIAKWTKVGKPEWWIDYANI